MDAMSLVVGALIGAAVGGLFVGLVVRLRAQATIGALEAQLRGRDELRETFKSLASDVLRDNSTQYLEQADRALKDLLDAAKSQSNGELGNVVTPLRVQLESLKKQVDELERNRAEAYGNLGGSIKTLADAHEKLDKATTRLSEAMKSSTARGRWGEIQLRRIVELAGMEEHIDFDEQAETDEGRPDMTINLPDQAVIYVDAKAPAAAYLEALKLDGEPRRAKLDEHVRAMRARIKQLASRQYGSGVKKPADVVVMFVPIESAVAAAYEEDAGLLEYGWDQKPTRVLVATPTTLYALLKTIAFGWDQARIAQSMDQLVDDSREFYGRLVTFVKHLHGLGGHLIGAVDDYDKAVGSWRSRLEPAARRLKEMTASKTDTEKLEPVDHVPQLPLDPSA